YWLLVKKAGSNRSNLGDTGQGSIKTAEAKVIITDNERNTASDTKGRTNSSYSHIFTTVWTEQGRATRGKLHKLLFATQTVGWKEQFLQSLYEFIKKRHTRQKGRGKNFFAPTKC
ncbi:MAG: hypothetical protein D3907_01330, partial [Candidatus Electrothrix sp. AUS3]|nr:hypothetical protein [Candidatus Electrothrix gigas]